MLEYKPDWAVVKQNYIKWWHHEYFGRCAIAVTAPKNNPPPANKPPPPKSIRQQWYDLKWINSVRQYEMARTFYGGEALPIWSAGYPGNTFIPVFLGAKCNLDWTTGWIEEPILKDSLDFYRLKINKKHPDYIFHIKMCRKASEWMKGKGLVTIGAFGGSGDTLAALRGNEQLLYDCVDRPDWVMEAEEYLMEMWCEHYSTLYVEIKDVDEGSTCWFPLWAPGKFYAAQNDFSYMISPRMFREIFLPVIKRQTEFLDYSVYHVDGIGAFAHVDALCELPRLQAIQILPGAGKPSPLHFAEVLCKVQKAGKNLHITIGSDEVEKALKMLSARGLFIHTWCETEDKAEELLDNVEKWSVDRG